MTPPPPWTPRWRRWRRAMDDPKYDISQAEIDEDIREEEEEDYEKHWKERELQAELERRRRM